MNSAESSNIPFFIAKTNRESCVTHWFDIKAELNSKESFHDFIYLFTFCGMATRYGVFTKSIGKEMWSDFRDFNQTFFWKFKCRVPSLGLYITIDRCIKHENHYKSIAESLFKEGTYSRGEGMALIRGFTVYYTQPQIRKLNNHL